VIAASLKHDVGVDSTTVIIVFPRSRDRGLIEAQKCGHQRLMVAGFRGHVIAASLKQGLFTMRAMGQHCFRGHVIAASLKHSSGHHKLLPALVSAVT